MLVKICELMKDEECPECKTILSKEKFDECEVVESTCYNCGFFGFKFYED